jgi:sialate O-acetylesterase
LLKQQDVEAECLGGIAYTIQVSNQLVQREVGERLAFIALAKTYGRSDVVYQGPVFKEMKIEDDKIRILFDHAESGLFTTDGKPLTWFTIAGDDMVFTDAGAVIEGGSVVVKSDKVKHPKAVCYSVPPCYYFNKI